MNGKEFFKACCGECSGLLIGSDWNSSKGDKLIYGRVFTLDDFKSFTDEDIAVFFSFTDKGVKLTSRGKKTLNRYGFLANIKPISKKELDALRLDGETQSGYAYERYAGKQLDRADDLEKKDILFKANFTATRKSSRKIQVKLMITGNSANFKK